MLLIKFGGSSVGSVENLQRVVQIVKKQTEPFIMVVSAFSGVTNTLQSLGENALKNTHQLSLRHLKKGISRWLNPSYLSIDKPMH